MKTLAKSQKVTKSSSMQFVLHYFIQIILITGNNKELYVNILI